LRDPVYQLSTFGYGLAYGSLDEEAQDCQDQIFPALPVLLAVLAA